MSVTVNIANGAIGGVPATSDGCIGIIMTGETEGEVTAGTPFLVTNEAEITALDLTTGNNPLAVKILGELVQEAKAQGVNEFQVYVQLMTDTVTVDDMVDVSNANGAVKLINYANGKIKVLFAISDDTLVYPGAVGLTTTNGINADCYTAITNAQALCVSYAALPKNWPMRAVIGCTSFTGTASSLTDITANTTNRVLAFIGDTESGDGCALGILAGRIIAVPVQRKVSRVLDRAVSNTTAYIATTTADQYTTTSTITGKGFVTWLARTGYNGFFFSSDKTACATTDDYTFLSRGRVIDKAHSIVVQTYNEQIDNEVFVNADGTIDANSAKQLQTSVERNINLAMTANQNITGVTAVVSTTQNVVSTSTVAISVRVDGVGYSSAFNIDLGFTPVE